jgi:hypothetical protein
VHKIWKVKLFFLTLPQIKSYVLMTKRLLSILLITTTIFVVPLSAWAVTYCGYAGVEQIDDTIVITVNQRSVTITGAQGETLKVVSLTGKEMLTVRIDSPSQRVELNVPRGCYILKVGNVVRKVSIK